MQRLKVALTRSRTKTVNNVLTVLSMLLKTAVEWNVIDRVPCVIRSCKVPKASMGFYDFEEYERLVEAAPASAAPRPIVLLGGDAGLRCGEIMALEWTDVNLQKRQLRRTFEVERARDGAERRTGSVRAADATFRRGAARRTALASPRVVCNDAEG